MNKTKFSKEAWLAAGFRALTTDGPNAIKAEALARSLGATKGSFYWNFDDIASFVEAMLGLWRNSVVQEIEDVLQAEPEKAARLRLLVDRAAKPASDEFGGRRVEPAMRSWALANPAVLAVVKEVDEIRLSFVTRSLRDVGQNDPALPQLVYGAFIGLDDLASKGSADIQSGLKVLLRLVAGPEIKTNCPPD